MRRAYALVALCALAACDRVFSLSAAPYQDAGPPPPDEALLVDAHDPSLVFIRWTRVWFQNSNSGEPLRSSDSAPLDGERYTYEVIRSSGVVEPAILDELYIQFEHIEAARYRLRRTDRVTGEVIELQHTARDVRFEDRVMGRPDPMVNTAPLDLTVSQVPNGAEVHALSTGVYHDLTLEAVNDSRTGLWRDGRPLDESVPFGLVDFAMKNDLLFVARYGEPKPSPPQAQSYVALTGVAVKELTLSDGGSVSIDPLPAELFGNACIHVDADHRPGLMTLASAGYTGLVARIDLLAVPFSAWGGADGHSLAYRTRQPTDPATAQPFIYLNPFQGTDALPTIRHSGTRILESPDNVHHYRLTAEIRQTAPTDGATACPMSELTAPMPIVNLVMVGSVALATDSMQFAQPPGPTTTVTWTMGPGLAADYYEITLRELVINEDTVRDIITVVTTTPSAVFDSMQLVSGNRYVFEIRAFRGAPQVSVGHFDETTQEFSRSISHSQSFIIL